ncbi:MAG: TonB-dependent receptor, partial [Gammaproteobacteria bacterium]|nr:TonB-dependent receptor [Gammaproteobacteria bacterium]
IMSFAINGSLGRLAGGDVQVAAGFESIDNSFEFVPSQDLAAGTIAGFNGAPGLKGAYDVDEFFVEAYLPIMDNWDIEVAFRSADYSTVGSVDSMKFSTSFEMNDIVRFRGGYNTAVRAPNIAELFAPQAEGFPGALDPCSSDTPAGGQTAELRALCEATGVPAGSVFTPAIAPPAGQIRGIFGGNPLLQEEEAETVTFGVVLTPNDNLSISLDYFDIEIEDAVTGFGGGVANIMQNCYLDPVLGGQNSDFCNVINRRADGTIDYVEVLSQNVASIALTGFDIIAEYSMDMAGGEAKINYVATLTDESSFQAFDGSNVVDCAGLFGAICGEPTPEYKHLLTFSWSKDDISARATWRYIGEVNDDDDGTDYTVETIDGTSYLDVSGTYHITDSYRVTAGIDNLIDEEPPVIGANDEQANTYPATYDVFGRTFFVKFTATF